MKKIWLFSVLSFCCVQLSVAQINKATEGFLDARSVNLNDPDQVLKLDGKWEFYWEELIAPTQFITARPRPAYIDVPSLWNDHYHKGKELTGEGYATYRLRVLLDNAPPFLSIELPNVYTSYNLFINGNLVSGNGTVGKSKAESKPEWRPRLKVFKSSDTLDIVCQVSNYYHNRGGIHTSFYIGNFDNVAIVREKKVVANMVLTGGLSVLGLFFLIFY